MAGPYLVVDNDRPGRSGEPGYLAVCVTNLDGMGRLTSLFGSEVAGAAAQEYAARLEALTREGDELIAINECKHCLLFRGLKDRNHASLAGLKLERLFAEAFAYNDIHVNLTVRAGIACAKASDTDAEELFRAAEAAREAARGADKVFELAEDVDVAALQQRWRLNDQLDEAIRQHDLVLYYQPKVRAEGGGVCGAEGLVRWVHKDGVLAPGQFVPYLDADKLTALTRHVVRQCVRDLAAHPELPPLSVNLEPHMLADKGLLRLLLDELTLWDVAAERLTVEITERGLVDTVHKLSPEFHEMRERGVRVAIDDFGTGHSSLAQFRDLPLDELKIDRCFVSGLAADETSRYLTRMMVDLGHHFGLTVVGEGVETTECADILRELGSDHLQGFCFSPALPREEFSGWVAERRRSLPAT